MYINYEIELDDLEESACIEMNGPGYFLRYRALIKKIISELLQASFSWCSSFHKQINFHSHTN